MQTLSNAKT